MALVTAHCRADVSCALVRRRAAEAVLLGHLGMGVWLKRMRPDYTIGAVGPSCLPFVFCGRTAKLPEMTDERILVVFGSYQPNFVEPCVST